MVLFTVQYSMGFSYRDPRNREFVFGLNKGNTAVSLQHTAVTSGSLGSVTELAYQSFEHRQTSHLVLYQVPVSVTRNTEVTISPTIKTTSGVTVRLENSSVMILTAYDIGAYG